MKKNYLPHHILEDAKIIHKKDFADTQLICGVLASLSEHEEKKFFSKLQEKEYLFYDYILPERNIYYPTNIFYGLYIRFRLGKLQYSEYMKLGALRGLLYKYGFHPKDVSIRFFGAFAAIHAIKRD